MVAVTTIILRINEDREGIRGTAEIPGGESRTFSSDDDLLDILYEWTGSPEMSGKGSGSRSRSVIRET